MNYYQVTAPSTEPITLDEAKLFLRVDSNVEDTLISALITTARQKVEADTWRALITQTWKLSLDRDEVKTFIGITKSPIQSVSHVKYFDINVIQQTLSTGTYQSNLLNEPAIIKINSIPQMADIMNSMEIQFVCGYGVAGSVPEGLKEAIKLLIGHYYEHREAVSTTNMAELPLSYENLIAPYRVLFYPYN
jgi:uncharacterized phiE125 gp8 family phage protein